MTVRAVGLVPHPNRPSATELAKRAAARLVEHGVEVRVPGPDADVAGLGHLAVELDAFADGLDVVISLGGDGTMLRAVDLAYEAGVPVARRQRRPARVPDRGRARRTSTPRSTGCSPATTRSPSA